MTREQIVRMCEETTRRLASGEIKLPPLSEKQKARAREIIEKYRGSEGTGI